MEDRVQGKSILGRIVVSWVLVWLFLVTICEARIIVVNDDGPADFDNIQAAVDDSNNGDVVVVLPGTYTGSGNRDIDFGGRAITVCSTDPEDPCVVAATVIDCENVSGRRGFYFHGEEGPNSVVSGLTIKRGKIVGNPGKGGGIYCTGSSPTIENCVITNNQARGSNGAPQARDGYGGGICCESDSNPMIVGCSISNNTAGGGGGGSMWCSPMSGCTGAVGSGGDGYGGGIYSSSGSSLTIIGSIISNNAASGGSGGVYIETGWGAVEGADGGDARGGGIYCGSGVNIESCTILANMAEGGDGGSADMPGSRGAGVGGGIYGLVTISDSTVNGNQVLHGTGFAPNLSAHGGGIASLSGSSIINCLVVNNMVDSTGMVGWARSTGITGGDEIVNCTIYNNSSGSGPSYAVHGTAATEIRNCIVWGNDGDDVGGTVSVTYSCTEDVISGVGNIHSDPCFVSGPEGDYYLSQVAAGQVVQSPCVDAGSDLAANLGMGIYTTRTDEVGDEEMVDMGYHYPTPIGADVNVAVDLDMDELWMYQSMPGQSNSDLTASVWVDDDPAGNISYSYAWEILLPGDVNLAPVTVDGGGAGDAYWTFAARGCDEPGGLSDSGQTFTVRVTVTGDDYGNTGVAEAEFGIALLGDVNNDGVINVADRAIANAFWVAGSAGAYTLRDCDVNCNGVVNVADRAIANAIWVGGLGQKTVSNPCPLR